MKKIFSLLLVILLLAGCAETYDGPTEEIFVVSATSTSHYGFTEEDTLYHQTDYSYDIYGNQVMELEYGIRFHDEEAEPHLKTLRTFDENGNCTRQRQYAVSGLFPKKLVDIRYEYDEKGRMTAHLDQMQEQYSWTAVYDDEAKTMTCTYPHAVSVSFFDDHGNTVRQETTFENGETSAIIFEFRSDGQRISARYEETGGTTLYNYTYDDQGRVLSVTRTTDSGTQEMVHYAYDGNTAWQYNFDGTIIQTIYNELGHIVSVYHHDETGTITSKTSYYYDTIRVPAKEETP